jgi:hypothetical protein
MEYLPATFRKSATVPAGCCNGCLLLQWLPAAAAASMQAAGYCDARLGRCRGTSSSR